MKLNITLNGRLLSARVDDKPAIELSINESIWNSNWKISKSGRDIISIRERSKLFSSDKEVQLAFEGVAQQENLVLQYSDRRPNAVFEYKGNRFQIVFHSDNRFSFFRGDIQFARTKLRLLPSVVFSYDSLFDEQIMGLTSFSPW